MGSGWVVATGIKRSEWRRDGVNFQSLLICPGVLHGFLKARRILQLNISLEGIAQARHEDIMLLSLTNILTTSQKHEKFPMVLSDRPGWTQAREFAEWISPNGRSKMAIDCLLKLCPCWNPSVSFLCSTTAGLCHLSRMKPTRPSRVKTVVYVRSLKTFQW